MSLASSLVEATWRYSQQSALHLLLGIREVVDHHCKERLPPWLRTTSSFRAEETS
jgi:hypothetical protein